MKELEVIKFIKENKDWRNILKEKPYCIIIKDKDTFSLLKYNQIDSDFKIPLVRECRGLIINNETLEPVCIPFFKFFNYGEELVDKIDEESMMVSEKIDGSLIKFWCYNNMWHVSTNGMIDAYECELQLQTDKYKTFGDLFEEMYERYNSINP